MARPIRAITKPPKTPEQERQMTQDAMLDKLGEHQESLDAFLNFVETLHTSGVLSFMQGMLEAREPIGEIVMNKLNTDPNKNGMKNMIQMVMATGQFEPAQIARMVSAFSEGSKEAGDIIKNPDSDKPLGFFALFSLFKEPAIARTIRASVGFLRGAQKVMTKGREK